MYSNSRPLVALLAPAKFIGGPPVDVKCGNFELRDPPSKQNVSAISEPISFMVFLCRPVFLASIFILFLFLVPISIGTEVCVPKHGNRHVHTLVNSI